MKLVLNRPSLRRSSGNRAGTNGTIIIASGEVGIVDAIPGSVPTSGQLPSGTVTFAFTDIEGSVQRWERDQPAMQEAVRRHDALVHAALTAYGGNVFKTVGDAFCAAFSRPQDAVAAALAVQRTLAAEDFSSVGGLHVRAAIHTGTADERDGDYFGPVLNRVARLLAIGHGGQVLVSGVTSDLVRGALPSQASLRDLGEHSLKDLARPEQVYQLLAPDLRTDFPALRSVEALPNDLPASLTRFVGREAEVGAITELLDKHRLVTVIGSGGIGKTRTSLQVAMNLIDTPKDGVWFIELAPLAAGEYIPATVAQAFGLQLPADGDPVENCARALKAKHALLVFDNCEHLVESVAHFVATLLRGCAKLKVLATSRQGLGIAGEATYQLPSLPVPAAGGSERLCARDAGQWAAIALFVERASADKRFALTDENASIVADVCRRLDGIPLAIELAAARVKSISPGQLRARLDERFRLLTRGSRDVMPRQQTLRALIDWSYDLLDARERTLFRHLSIFASGFTLEAAVAVVAGEDLEVLDLIASLVDKSLVLAEPAGDVLRYRLLESTRIYASEMLVTAGEREACVDRHLRYMHGRFSEARERFEKTAQWSALDEPLARELEEVRAALERALSGSGSLLGGEILAEIGNAWGNLGLDNEGLARAEAFLSALAESDQRLVARLSISVAMLAGDAGQKTRRFECATQAVARARACGDPRTLAEALFAYSLSATTQQRIDGGEAALLEAEAIPGISPALRLRLQLARAGLDQERGNLDAAALAYEQLRDRHHALGNSAAARIMTVNLAETEHARGRTQRAIELVYEALPASRTHSDRQHLVLLLVNLAGYLAALDAVAGARTTARDAIQELATREPESTFVAIAIEHLALAFALGGDLPRAVALARYADNALVERGFQREFTERTTRERLAALLRECLPPHELALCLSKGAALTAEGAIAVALEEP